MRHQSLQMAKLLCLAGLFWSALADGTIAQDDSGFKFVEVTVVDPEGKPLANTSVDVVIDDMEFAMPTNDQGQISLNVPSGGNSRLVLTPKHEDFVTDTSYWRGGKQIPTEITLKLDKGVAVGGIIQDEKGQPIEGVKVRGANFEKIQVGENSAVSMHPYDLATTDAEGRWKATVKQPESKQLSMQLSHDDYICNPTFGSLATWEQLTRIDHVLTLKKGLELIGRITDEQDEPIAGARLILGRTRYLSSEGKKEKITHSDAAGHYRFGNVNGNRQYVTVTARGRAPEMRRVLIVRDMEPVDFTLQPGHKVKLLVTDVDGVPIAGVGVMADEWRGNRTFPEDIYRGETDDQGIWQSDSMPADVVSYDLFKREYMSLRDQKIVAGEKSHTLVLGWPLEVTGKVVDAESGLPLEKFNVAQGIDWGNSNQQIHWERYNDKQGEHGKFRIVFNEPRAGHLVRIEAEGYRPNISRVLRDDEGEVTINFEMEIGTGHSGTVKTPDGQPAAGAQLMIATREETLYFHNAEEQNSGRKLRSTTDKLGQYKLPFAEDGFIAVCLHDTGWARLTSAELDESADIQLQAWATIEGVVMQGAQPMANESLQLYFQQHYVQNAPYVHWGYGTTSDAEGKFKIERAIAGEATVARIIRIGDDSQGSFMSAYSHAEPVTLAPGQTVRVQIGGLGRKLRGQFKAPEDASQVIAWNMASVQLYSQPQQNAGGFFHALGKAIGQLGSQTTAPPESNFQRSYAANIDEAGAFEIADVQPGRYQMTVQVYPLPEGGQQQWQPIATYNQVVNMPKENGKTIQDTIDLGEFTLKMVTPAPANQLNGIIMAAPAE